MTRLGEARTQLMLVLGLVLLLPAFLTAPSASPVVLAAAVAAVALAGWCLHRSAVAFRAALAPPQVRAAGEISPQRSDRATDPVHSPLSTRAPGLV